MYSIIRIFILFFIMGTAFADYPGSIKTVNGTPTLHINDSPVYASALRWIIEWGTNDRLFFQERNGPIQQFGEAKTPVIILGMDSGWKGPGIFNYTAIDKAIDKVFHDYPEAYLIPSIHLEYARWYSSKHPKEAFTIKENHKLIKRGASIIASFNSKRFKKEACEALAKFIKHMSERGYAKRIIGYQVNYGRTAEWNYWDNRKRPDWNQQSVIAWRGYVKRKYKSIDRLNAAWKTSLSGFKDVNPPDGRFRNVYSAGYLRDPAGDCKITDYKKFVEDSIAHLMKVFSSHVKSLTGNRALVGMYNAHNKPRLDNCSSIDFTVSSTIYVDRAANGTALSQARGLEYIRRTGKLYWHDSDMRTYLWPDEVWGVCRNVYESIMVMRREFASMFINGAGNSWFNLHYHRNVFDNPQIMQAVADLEAFAATAVSRMQYDLSSVAEIAVIYDRQSAPAFWGNACLYSNYTRIGAAVDFFPSDQIKLVDPDQYKLIIMVSNPFISESSRQHIERLKGGKRTILFLYANGIETAKGLDIEAASKLCGFKFKRLPGLDRLVLIDPKYKSKFSSEIIALGKAIGPATAFRLTVIPRSGDKVIGCSIIDKEPLFVEHKYRDWTAIYYHNYQTHTRILRQIARQAGVTINCPKGDGYFQRNRNFWLVNGISGNTLLNLGSKIQQVYDIFNDQLISVKNGRVLLKMTKNETKVLLTDTPERIQEFRRIYREERAKRKISIRKEKFEMDVIPNDNIFYFMSGRPRSIKVRVRANRAISNGTLQFILPNGWHSESLATGSLQQYEVKNFMIPVTTNHADGNCKAVLKLVDSSSGKTICEKTLLFASRNFTYLSDLSPLVGTTGWGNIERDKSCTKRTLTVGKYTNNRNTKFQKGIGVHANSKLIYNLDARWSKLTGQVGVDIRTGTGGIGSATVQFKIIGDGRELFNSGRRTGGQQPVKIAIDISGIKKLQLLAGDSGDGQSYDHADWCDIKLFP